MTAVATRRVGAPLDRVEGREKVTGAARYAYEHPAEGVAYAVVVQATIAARRDRAVDAAEALALPGVLAVHLARERAARSPTPTTASCRCCSPTRSPTAARSSPPSSPRRSRPRARRAALVQRRLRRRASTTSAARRPPGLYTPEKVNPAFPTDTEQGDADAALAARRGRASTRPTRRPALHNNPMEPHATLALWDGRRPHALRLHPGRLRAPATRSPRCSGWSPSRCASISPHVGGGFGSKGTPRPHVVARRDGRARSSGGRSSSPLTRQQMFALRRLPHADDPARPARRRRATAGCTAIAHESSSRPRRCASSPSRPRSPRA